MRGNDATDLITEFYDPASGMTCRHLRNDDAFRAAHYWAEATFWTVCNERGHAAGDTLTEAMANHRARHGLREVRHAA